MKEVIGMKMTVYDARKEVFGVGEISPKFQSKIHELFYQQTKAVTMGRR